MNILILPDVGRSYNSVRPEAEIYIGLAKAGHNVTIMTDLSGVYVPHFREANIKLIELVPRKKISRSAIKLIRQAIVNEKIDLVYATRSRTISNAALACTGTKAKLVTYRGTTGGLYWHDPINFLGTLHPRVDGIICVSNAVEAHVKGKVRKKIHPFVRTIYKGHDLDWYRSDATDLNSLGVNPDHFNILSVGSNRPHKGMKYLIEAASYLKDLEKLNIILVGDGFNKEPFTSQIQQTGMADRIIQPGFRSDVPQLAAACDLFILPSVREGLPRAMIESLSYGTPAITTNSGGPAEVIEDGVNGFIVPNQDAKAIAEHIRTLYNDRILLQSLSQNCEETIRAKFDHHQTVKNYIHFFEEIISA